MTDEIHELNDKLRDLTQRWRAARDAVHAATLAREGADREYQLALGEFEHARYDHAMERGGSIAVGPPPSRAALDAAIKALAVAQATSDARGKRRCTLEEQIATIKAAQIEADRRAVVADSASQLSAAVAERERQELGISTLSDHLIAARAAVTQATVALTKAEGEFASSEKAAILAGSEPPKCPAILSKLQNDRAAAARQVEILSAEVELRAVDLERAAELERLAELNDLERRRLGALDEFAVFARDELMPRYRGYRAVTRRIGELRGDIHSSEDPYGGTLACVARRYAPVAGGHG